MEKYGKEEMTFKKTLKINGMHCASCEVLLERKFKQVKGIEKVIVSHSKGEAELHCSCDPNIKELNSLIIPHGYSIAEQLSADTIKITRDHIEIGAIFIIVFGIYLFLKQFNLLPQGLSITDNMSYGFVFLIGLVAAASTCMAITGGLLLAISAKFNEKNKDLTKKEKFRPHIYFNFGRIVSYTILGGVVGALGSFLQISDTFAGILTIIASILMIIVGLQLLNIFKFLNKIQVKMPKFIAHKIYDKSSTKAPFFLGASTFFLPCGFTQALQIYILAKGDIIIGAITMLAFALGTLPGLLSIGVVSSSLKEKHQRYFTKFAAVIVIMLGIFNISSGLTLTGTNVAISNLVPQEQQIIQDPNVKLVDGKQIVEMAVNGLDYSPDVFTIKSGIPVEWRVDGKGAQGCAQILSAPTLKIREFIGGTIKTITFTPSKPGKIRFSCSMGMAGPGVFNVL